MMPFAPEPNSTAAAPSGDIWTHLPAPLTGVKVAAAAIAMTVAATLVGAALSHWLPQQSVALVYLLTVMLAALAFGMSTALSVALLAFLAYNFFFIEPLYTFTIADPQELFALLVFLAVALLSGSLAGRMREVADAAWRRASTLQTLNDFAGELAGSRSVESSLSALAGQAGATIRGHAIVLIGDRNALRIAAATAGAPALEPVEMQAAQRTFRSGETIHAAAPGWPGPQFEFQPFAGTQGIIGVVGLAPFNGQRTISGDDAATLQTLFRHAAIAIERTRLEADTALARDDAERERLRSALLSSLSHDLRTPLASILGAATSLRELGPAMTPEMRADLLVAIEEEAERLSRFVSNLLDMTRLEADAIDLMRDWVDVGEVTQAAVARARRLFPHARITLEPQTALPAIRADTTLIEHVVFNLLDNAVKFSAADAPIAVALGMRDSQLQLTIMDQGRGIAADALPHVFEAFYRTRGDTVPGTGLGLAICKRIIEGLGGTITAESPAIDGRGTRIVVRLPVPIAQPITQLQDRSA